MRKKWQLGLAFSLFLVMHSLLFGLCYAQGVEIPYAPEGWTLDGILSDGDRRIAGRRAAHPCARHA
jgi:hypothetical protein